MGALLAGGVCVARGASIGAELTIRRVNSTMISEQSHGHSDTETLSSLYSSRERLFSITGRAHLTAGAEATRGGRALERCRARIPRARRALRLIGAAAQHARTPPAEHRSRRIGVRLARHLPAAIGRGVIKAEMLFRGGTGAAEGVAIRAQSSRSLFATLLRGALLRDIRPGLRRRGPPWR